jgi:hypothetical protein
MSEKMPEHESATDSDDELSSSSKKSCTSSSFSIVSKREIKQLNVQNGTDDGNQSDIEDEGEEAAKKEQIVPKPRTKRESHKNNEENMAETLDRRSTGPSFSSCSSNLDVRQYGEEVPIQEVQENVGNTR